jgi:hypothetical protein
MIRIMAMNLMFICIPEKFRSFAIELEDVITHPKSRWAVREAARFPSSSWYLATVHCGG